MSPQRIPTAALIDELKRRLKEAPSTVLGETMHSLACEYLDYTEKLLRPQREDPSNDPQ